LFGTHANRQFPVVIIDLRTSLMFWSRRLGQLPCGEWGEFCNGLRRYSSAAITTALPQVMVERNDAKEDAMGEKRDIKETASLFGRRSALVLVAAVLPPPPGQPVPPYYRITEIYFDDVGTLQTGLGLPEWKTVVADVLNFADPRSITGFASLIGA
jgi:hypothetical protein